MSTLSEVLAATKKILLTIDDIKRLSKDSKDLSHKVADHEGRLIRIETVIEISKLGGRRALRGN